MRIGFIGLGVMGAPMAANLITAGHQLSIHRVKETEAHQQLLAQGATPAASPAEAAEGAEVVILMLPDTPDVEHVVRAPDGVLTGLIPGAVVVDMSSISPVATKELATAVEQAGGQYVDAPVSGGEIGAKEATLTIFVGGQAATVEQVMPILEAMGKNITHMGAAGAGQATKVVNQIIVGMTIEAVAEGLALAEASGIDPATVTKALSGGFASSKILEVHGRRMVNRTFEPGFRLKLHRKDLRLALDAGAHHHTPLPGTQVVAAQMDQALQKGWAERDHAALFALLTEDADAGGQNQ
ncbi:NAD(P)-dependent oxidoreductase [Nesterenkonia ebinurensis]|uniref:NAD(P)-dependent oxidoreductase n=1 Tax=Nesterenkonia ebinurensis TaxID=2608252 RepID=UPI00123D6FB9|nr:NAD(P)-dependent oxidoreductase [Nesterenkonia ebinurensis]